MSWHRRSRPALLIVSLLGLSVALPLAAQDPEIAAAPPPEAAVFRITPDLWEEPICAGVMEWTYQVPAGEWVGFPIGWIATDHPTAISNWDRMRFELWVDDRELEVPTGLNWELHEIHYACPGGAVDGVAFAPMVYLPPLTAERHYRIRFIFQDEVNRGFSTFAKGTDLMVRLNLRPTVWP